MWYNFIRMVKWYQKKQWVLWYNLLARIYVYAENTEKLKQAIHKVQACLHVEDTDGNPMLLQGFDVDSYNWND